MASGVMDDLREKLEEIKGLERAGIQHRLDDRQDSSSQQRQPGQESQPSDGQPSPGQQGEQGDGQQEQGQSGQQGQRGRPGQMGQMGQGGQSGESGDDLTPEQKRKMLEMIAKRKQDYLNQLPQDIPGQIKGL